MVGGAVAPPRLDLANEDLVRSHVQAIWLAETGQDLRGSLTEVLDVAGDNPSLELLPEVRERLTDPAAAQRAAARVRAVLAGMRRASPAAPWWRDGWVDDAVSQAPQAFDDACNRWRDLYRLALQEFRAQSRAPWTPRSRTRNGSSAARRARDARIQLNLLSNEDSDDFQTDFYSYRYFASEGFLPGYSFPRLPLAAYIPGLAGRREGRLHPAAPVHRHRRVRPRRGHLPRGCPLPGRQRGPAASRAGPGRHGHHHRPPLPRLRVPAPRGGRHRCLRALRRAAARHHPGTAAPDLGAHRAPGPDLLR